MNTESPLQRSWVSAYGPLFSLFALLALALAVLFLTAKSASQPPAPPAAAPPAAAAAMDSKTAYEAVQGIVRKTGADFRKVTDADRKVLDEAGRGDGKRAYEQMVETLKKANSLSPAKAR